MKSNLQEFAENLTGFYCNSVDNIEKYTGFTNEKWNKNFGNFGTLSNSIIPFTPRDKIKEKK